MQLKITFVINSDFKIKSFRVDLFPLILSMEFVEMFNADWLPGAAQHRGGVSSKTISEDSRKTEAYEQISSWLL